MNKGELLKRAYYYKQVAGYYFDVTKNCLPTNRKGAGVLFAGAGLLTIPPTCNAPAIEADASTVPGREEVFYIATNGDIDVEGWGDNVPATENPPGGQGCTLNTGLPNGEGGFDAVGWDDCKKFDGPRGKSPVKWPGVTVQGKQPLVSSGD